MLPAYHAQVFRTANGTPYLKEPGVFAISAPHVDLEGMQGFLDGFDEELGFDDYLKDDGPIADGDQLIKTMGQLCYASFGPNRSRNANAQTYENNLKASGHGSVLEHAYVSVIMYGIDRAVTHEAVRHRAGLAISQVSQRYVDGKVLRFVEASEFQNDPELHAAFERDIDEAVVKYNQRAQRLLVLQGGGDTLLSGEKARDLRKKVNQAARRVLPNETEAPIGLTGNCRAWRHMIEMRASEHADVSIRSPYVKALKIVKEIVPICFSDYEIITLPDGTQAAKNEWRKV